MSKSHIFYKNLNKNIFLIFSISLAYGYLINIGIYGFSNDYYGEYYKSNLIYNHSYREFGSLLSTLTVWNINFGLFLTSFFLAFTVGIFFYYFLVFKNKFLLITFLIFYIIILHIHPIIMSTSGAMRQGWTMSFIFLSFAMILKEKRFSPLFFMFVALFLHKSGLFYFFIFVTTYSFIFLIKFFSNKKIILIFTGIFIFLLLLFSYEAPKESTKIIEGDFRFFWLFINIFYILIYLSIKKIYDIKNEKFIALFCFFFSCAAPAFLFMGYNWEYERLNMVMGVVYVLIFGSFFKKNSINIYLFISLSFYLFLTVYQGMYSKGLT